MDTSTLYYRPTGFKSFISPINFVDGAEVSIEVSQELAAFPAENLLKSQISDVWRTSKLQSGEEGDDTETYIEIDLRVDRKISVIGLMTPRYHDFFDVEQNVPFADASVDLVTITYYDSSDEVLLEDADIAFGIDPYIGYFVRVLESDLEDVRKIRFDFTLASRQDIRFFDVGRVWAGPLYGFRINYEYGAQISWDADDIKTNALRSQVVYADPGERFRTATMRFNALDNSEAAVIQLIDRLVTQANQIIFCYDTDDVSNKSIIGYSSKENPVIQTSFNRNTKTYQLSESR